MWVRKERGLPELPLSKYRSWMRASALNRLGHSGTSVPLLFIYIRERMTQHPVSVHAVYAQELPFMEGKICVRPLSVRTRDSPVTDGRLAVVRMTGTLVYCILPHG